MLAGSFSNRHSQRFSTVSEAPSLAPSDSSSGSLPSGDPRLTEIKTYTERVERLESKPLLRQRFIPTPEKEENLNKLALGAKVERALGRRMTSQDAVMRRPVLSEKKAAEDSDATRTS